MTLQFSTAVRTTKAGAYQSVVQTSGTLIIYSGAEPASCAAADPSGVLVTVSLPSTFLTAAAGATTLAGSWTANARRQARRRRFASKTTQETAISRAVSARRAPT